VAAKDISHGLVKNGMAKIGQGSRNPVIAPAAILSCVGTGGAVSVCVIGEVTAARACWDRRHHLWFWLTLAATALIQSAVIILVPWPVTRFPGIVLLPIGLADCAVVYAVIRFVERLSI
jgi:ABC-type branched-subunit amino acid transport system permease subunit